MRLQKHTSCIVNHPKLFARHTSRKSGCTPVRSLRDATKWHRQQLRRRRLTTSFNFTDRPTRLYRNMRSIWYIYSKYSCPIRAKHITEHSPPINLSRHGIANGVVCFAAEFHRPAKTSNFIRPLVFKTKRTREKKKKLTWRCWDLAS